ncbi:hypothetical protein [Erythrobacter sp. KY5]|uniref:hypothetical protein n=1 Tax=Erythrobacter sp. KY5 TaxID=2011159 RepID=UPI0013A6EF9E|nr:hypothetical protein [Erythrobacter sp. KY5]
MELCISKSLSSNLADAEFAKLLKVYRGIQAGLALKTISLADQKPLGDQEVFAGIVQWALDIGISAAEIAEITGVARSTPARWADRSATPRYEEAREVFSRKILKRISEESQRRIDQCGFDSNPSVFEVISITDEECSSDHEKIRVVASR